MTSRKMGREGSVHSGVGESKCLEQIQIKVTTDKRKTVLLAVFW